MSLKRKLSNHDPCSDTTSSKDIKLESDQEVVITHVRDYKKELNDVLVLHSKNCGEFVLSSRLPDIQLPLLPLIDIQDFGILPTPLTKLNFDNLFAKFNPGEKQSPPASIFIECGKFSIQNEEFKLKVKALIEDEVKPGLGLNGVHVSHRIDGVILCSAGCKYNDIFLHCTERDSNTFGVLLVQLPSIFTGGKYVVTHNKSDKVFELGTVGSRTHNTYVAHFSSCRTNPEEITSGYATCLVYSLCYKEGSLKPSPYTSTTNSVKLCNLINEFLDTAGNEYLLWTLEDTHSLPCIEFPEFVGGDENVFCGVEKALDYDKLQFGKDRYELFIADAVKDVDEKGTCPYARDYERDYYDRYRRYSSDSNKSCDGECDGEFTVSDKNYKLENFYPLRDSTFKADRLALSFSPRQHMINYNFDDVLNDDYSSDDDDSSSDNSDKDKCYWGDPVKTSACDLEDEGYDDTATRNRVYKRNVLVIIKADQAFSLKLGSENAGELGVDHVLQLVHSSRIDEAKEALKKVLECKHFDHKDLCKMLVVFSKLNKKDDIPSLLYKMLPYGIPNDKCAKDIAGVVSKYWSDEVKVAFIQLLKKTNRKKVQSSLFCCNLIPHLQPGEVISALVESAFQGNSSIYYGSSLSARDDPEVKLLLDYMFNKNVFPAHDLKILFQSLNSLEAIHTMLSSYIVKGQQTVLHVLLLRCTELLIAINNGSNRLIDESMTRALVIIKLLLSHNKKDEVKKLVTSFLPHVKRIEVMYVLIDSYFRKSVDEKFVLEQFVQRFLHMSSTIQERNFYGVEGVLNIIDFFLGAKSLDCLEKFTEGIVLIAKRSISTWTLQDLASNVFVKYNKSNVPQSLMKICKIRFGQLQDIVSKGKPPFSWHQPNASVPEHPQVETFLKGPKEKLIYRNFKGLPDARKWSMRHKATSTGCYMNIVVGPGVGKAAFVTITKTTTYYDRLVAEYTRNLTEYRRFSEIVVDENSDPNTACPQAPLVAGLNSTTPHIITID